MESQLNDLRDDVKDIHSKMDQFIDTANKTYATKKEVYDIEARFCKSIEKRDGWIRWLPQVISVLVAIVALVIASS